MTEPKIEVTYGIKSMDYTCRAGLTVVSNQRPRIRFRPISYLMDCLVDLLYPLGPFWGGIVAGLLFYCVMSLFIGVVYSIVMNPTLWMQLKLDVTNPAIWMQLALDIVNWMV